MKRFALFILFISSLALFFSCSTVDSNDDDKDPGTIVDGIPTGNWIMQSVVDTAGVSETLTIYDKVILTFNGSQVILYEFDDSDSSTSIDTVHFEFNSTFDTITIDSLYQMAMEIVGLTIVETGANGVTTYAPYNGSIPPTEWELSIPVDTTPTDTGSVVDGTPEGVWISNSVVDTLGVAQTLTDLDKTVFIFNGSQVIVWEFDDSDSSLFSDTVTYLFNSTFDTITIDDSFKIAMQVIGNTIVEEGDSSTTTYIPYGGPLPLTAWAEALKSDSTHDGGTPLMNTVWMNVVNNWDAYTGTFHGDSSREYYDYTSDSYFEAWMLQFIDTTTVLEIGNNTIDNTYYQDSTPYYFLNDTTVIYDNDLTDPATVKITHDTLIIVQTFTTGTDIEVFTMKFIPHTGEMPPKSWTGSQATGPSLVGQWESTSGTDVMTVYMGDSTYNISMFDGVTTGMVESGTWTQNATTLFFNPVAETPYTLNYTIDGTTLTLDDGMETFIFTKK